MSCFNLLQFGQRTEGTMTQQKENADLLAQFQAREAGVADLVSLYDKIEAVYSSSVQALQPDQTVTISDSTNFR